MYSFQLELYTNVKMPYSRQCFENVQMHLYNDLLVENRKFSLPLSHIAPSIRVTPYKFLEKLYGFWK